MPQPTDPLDSLIDRLKTEARRAIRSRSIEAVHDIRVAIRRLYQGIELYRAAKKARKPLRHLMALAGEVRDCDVAMKLLAKPWAKGSERLRKRIAGRREPARKMLAAELKSWIEGVTEWRTKLGTRPQSESSAKALNTLPKMADDFLRRGERLAVKHPDPATLHELRLQAKELRYSIELMKPALGAAANAWIQPIQEVQSALGDVNDCRIVLDLADELGGANGVERTLRKRLRKKIRKFRGLWQQHFSGGATKEWVRALEPPRKPMARSRTAATRGRVAAPNTRAAKRA